MNEWRVDLKNVCVNFEVVLCVSDLYECLNKISLKKLVSLSVLLFHSIKTF